ncbi:mannan endo-1,4-beta-mannosidase-like [Ylistrum balloti]|uniref:mannan endo-1,4-beta-mannosidase-like n=1 Tax=Ylistrum balloti TaxID=509963 RepID=UPI002905EC0C|nr:mannan endo-1,4-beta-mannosidase-like [Ylistrum balloti]
MFVLLLAVVTTLGVNVSGKLYVCGTGFCYGHGTKVFLSGVNMAWDQYGHDFGKHQYNTHHKSMYESIARRVAAAGGNSIRVWVHTEGQISPKFDSRGMVTDTDDGHSLISELQSYIRFARTQNLFVFLCLWNGALKQAGNERLQGLITSTTKLQSYIDHALVPMVNALKNEPNLGGWDIMNEPEGEIIVGHQDTHQPCYDTRFLHNSGAGWVQQMYTAKQIQRFVNWQANAIRQHDQYALVTVGSWNPKSNTGSFNMRNLYSDHCLVTAGGKSNGKLNFFSTHTYSSKGSHKTYDSVAPFRHNASVYGLNRPLVVAEFNQVLGGGWTIDGQFPYLYTHGYAGAWSWHARANGEYTDTLATQEKGLRSISGRTSHGHIRIQI